MNIDEQIKVMQAFRDGAEIESTGAHGTKTHWTDCPNPHWSWDTDVYRIKEKPKTVTLSYYRFSGGEVKIFDVRPCEVILHNGKPPELIYTQTIELEG